MTQHLLVIGAQRCGTTYLRDHLDQHPEIAMAQPARPEPKVFCSEEAVARGREWYRATWFAEAGDAKILGDKSTSYLECEGAGRRAEEMLGAPLVLAQLRDPVARAISNWRFSRDNGMEDRTVEQALADNLAGHSPPWDRARFSVSPYAYLERGRYVDFLMPWRHRFGPRLRVQFFEEQTASTEAFADLFGWLGVDPAFVPDGVDRAVNSSVGEQPSLDSGLTQQLRGYFKDSDDALETMLGQGVPWRGGSR